MADHVLANRRYWDDVLGEWFGARARTHWAATEPFWGTWNIPQSQLPVIPDDVAGLDTVELGCGTGYVSAWLARRGARPVGVDNSARQLATARAMQTEFDLPYPLVHADAERVPLRDGCADLVISEYGAAAWCDPYRWIPEAARLLRPRGRLVFMAGSTLAMLCMLAGGTVGDRLVRDQFGLKEITWPDNEGVVFQLPHGERIRLLRSCGLVVEDLIEVRAPEGAVTDYETPLDWARRWPSEEVWFARRE
ncbi:MAG TPA: methyltransferase domain-containing protein [Micromonosporaceae bacterium]|nr:methyltransferase domain-containing protein [Micromonosporaceae bacterium]